MADFVWIVTKVLRIQRDGSTVLLYPGDPIPEAELWRNQDVWERRGYIRKILRPTLSNPVAVRITHPLKAKQVEIVLTDVIETPRKDKSRKKGKKPIEVLIE